MMESLFACVADPGDASQEPAVEWRVANGPNCERRTVVNRQGLGLEVFSWRCGAEHDDGLPVLITSGGLPQTTPTKARGTVVLFHGIDVNCRFDFLRLRSMDFADDATTARIRSVSRSTSSGTDAPVVAHQTDGLKYERSLVAALNEAGFDCVGADMQSYGVSQGVSSEVSYFERFDHLVDDAMLIASDAVARSPPGSPLFFLGISFGGLLAASLVAACGTKQQRRGTTLPERSMNGEKTVKNGEKTTNGEKTVINGARDDEEEEEERRAAIASRLAGFALLAPALSLEKLKRKPTNAILLPIAEFLSRHAPQLALGDKAAGRYEQIEDAMARDSKLPRGDAHRTGCYLGKLRARVGAETLKATDAFRRRLQDLEKKDDSLLAAVPSLLVHSVDDTMCDPAGSTDFARAVGDAAQFVATQEIPGCDQMWHCLTQEPGCEALFQHLVDWLTKTASQVETSSSSTDDL